MPLNKHRILYISGLLLCVVFVIFSRFYGLWWGNSYFFHPDENNMATALSQISWTNFNPHFYAYGQFPLYLGFVTLKITGLSISFSNAIYVLRFWSALFSSGTILIYYLLSKQLFKKNYFIVPLLATFSPGLIQLAHFGTTESLLIFVFSFNILLALYYLKKPRIKWLTIAGIITGVGIASKLTAVFFITPFALALILSSKSITKKISFLVLYGLIALGFAIILSPYNFIDYSDFISSMTYETNVATGVIKVFYTSQFLHTVPYLFQLTKIIPYAAGLTITFFSIFGGILVFSRCTVKNIKANYKKISIFLIPCLIYFAYVGQLYTKWFRFTSPVFLIFIFLSSFFLQKINNRFVLIMLLIIAFVPGINFFKIYLSPDIRIIASNWIIDNLSPGSKMLSEAGNVINIPLDNRSLSINNFDFYNLDSNPNLPQRLVEAVADNNYILIPSRRIYKNQDNSQFPYSQKYYSSLFNGQLGFTLIKEFSPPMNLVLNDENAEETFSVFDHPTIRLYKKTTTLTITQLDQLLL